MKICVFSDIHGNGPAFRAAYPMMMSENADINIFLGDLCGYYFDQKEIFGLLQSIPNLIALKGNHDQFLLNILKGDMAFRDFYREQYGTSMEQLLKDNTEELSQWLSTLPETYSFHDLDLDIYHGSPWNPLEGYVYPDSSIEQFLEFPASLFFLGHTHHRMVRTIEDKMIVNPGSLGQPRGKTGPSYAVIDCSSRQVTFREVHYDSQPLLRQIETMDCNNPNLTKHLLFND